MNPVGIIALWWGAVLLVLLIFLLTSRFWFRLLGIILVPEDKIGLVILKFSLFGEKKEEQA